MVTWYAMCAFWFLSVGEGAQARLKEDAERDANSVS